MKKLWLYFLCGSIFIFAPYAHLQAAVLQSVDDALTNDTFVFRSKPSKNKKNIKSRHNVSTKKTSLDTNDATSSPQNADDAEVYQEPLVEENVTKTKAKNSDAGYGYTKKYASRLFKTFSGYITVEQKNIPNRLGVTKGSTVQFNLTETPDAIWHVELDEKIGKIVMNKVQGKQRIIVIQTLNEGNTRLFLDNISIKDNKYRIIFSKKMSLLVDE